jgi:hypothetical protein
VLRIYRPESPTASAGCETANFGTKGQHAEVACTDTVKDNNIVPDEELFPISSMKKKMANLILLNNL